MKQNYRLVGKQGSLLIGLLLLVIGCTTPQPASDILAPASACTTKDCFIASASDCKEMSITLTEKAGVFTYASSTDCVLTKTLVRLDTSEAPEMKTLLEGKTMTCKYEKGQFDERWVTSLIYGIENCDGELRDNIAELLEFA